MRSQTTKLLTSVSFLSSLYRNPTCPSLKFVERFCICVIEYDTYFISKRSNSCGEMYYQNCLCLVLRDLQPHGLSLRKDTAPQFGSRGTESFLIQRFQISQKRAQPAVLPVIYQNSRIYSYIQKLILHLVILLQWIYVMAQDTGCVIYCIHSHLPRLYIHELIS